MLRHIAWFNESPVSLSADGSLTSADLIVQRRCLIPARELEKFSIECSVFGNLQDADPAHVSNHLQKLDTDIVVVGRTTSPSLVKLARAAKHLGCYVVVDHGTEIELSPDFLKLTDIADQIVVSTTEAAAAIHARTALDACIIPDCDDTHADQTSDIITRLWLECFKHLKMKPPACANTNIREQA